MPGVQRIFVVNVAASADQLAGLRDRLGTAPLVLTAPTSEAKRVVGVLRVEPRVEVLLAPVAYPGTERGHRLDELVRSHALHDRFRDVVVVTDAASTTLLLRVLAPDQLASEGAVTLVGLPRGERPVDLRRTAIGGVLLGLVAGVSGTWVPILALPAVVAVAGLVLLLVPAVRHRGRELLLGSAVAATTVVLAVAGSARFPGSW